jgi:hypothetical protein
MVMKRWIAAINSWVDRQWSDIKIKEEEIRIFKITKEDIGESRADWTNFYKNTPIKPSDLINK